MSRDPESNFVTYSTKYRAGRSTRIGAGRMLEEPLGFELRWILYTI
jgi:hypothetical protein